MINALKAKNKYKSTTSPEKGDINNIFKEINSQIRIRSSLGYWYLHYPISQSEGLTEIVKDDFTKIIVPNHKLNKLINKLRKYGFIVRNVDQILPDELNDLNIRDFYYMLNIDWLGLNPLYETDGFDYTMLRNRLLT